MHHRTSKLWRLSGCWYGHIRCTGLGKCQTKRDALALHVRGWSWDSKRHLMQTKLLPNASNAEAKAQNCAEVPKTRKEEEEEEEEITHLRLVQV